MVRDLSELKITRKHKQALTVERSIRKKTKISKNKNKNVHITKSIKNDAYFNTIINVASRITRLIPTIKDNLRAQIGKNYVYDERDIECVLHTVQKEISNNLSSPSSDYLKKFKKNKKTYDDKVILKVAKDIIASSNI